MRKWGLAAKSKIAIVFEDRRITYGELNERVNSIANAFIDKGIKKGDRVAILLYNCNEFVELLFAAAKIGAISVPINYYLSIPEVKYILNDSGSGTLVFGKEFSELVNSLRQGTEVKDYIYLGKDLPSWAINMKEFYDNYPTTEPQMSWEVTFDDILVLIYTSGTTGRPKGAILTHGNIFWATINHILVNEYQGSDVMLLAVALFFAGSLIPNAFTFLHLGATLVLEKEFNPERALRVIEKEKCTQIMGVPTIWKFISDLPEFETANLDSLKGGLTGGAPVPVPLLEKYQKKGIRFSQGYGLTEGGGTNLTLRPEDAFRKVGSTGHPHMYEEVRLVNEKGEDVPIGEVGEVIIKGSGVSSGYWNDPEITANTIKDGWFHTGDIAKMDEEGYYYIVERKKDMIISGGINVYPAEIEDVIYGNPKVAEVGVIGVPDEKWTEVPKAIVVFKPGQEMTEEELIDFCNGKLAEYKIPKSVVFVDGLPRSGSGKVLKRVLREQHGRGSSSII